MATDRQNTVARPAAMEGTGLHSGAAARMRLVPAPAGTGIVFRRVDLDGAPEVPARVENVVETDRGTTIGVDGARVQTVEHLLAALSARQVDNVVVDLDGPEPPAGDGSAREFSRLLEEAGVEAQDAPARVLTLDAPVTVTLDRARYVAAPAPELRVSATIEYDHPLIGRQFASYGLDGGFAEEVAPARTFCFLRDVEGMRGRGLAQGGSVDNAVVLTDDGLAEGSALRFPDEFARHKVLDVIGDLALVGARVQGHVVAERPGHPGNVALAKELAKRLERKGPPLPVMSIEDIVKYLPHRYPFLLVDRVVEFEHRTRIVGIKNVTINEPFFQGHFPGRPVMPGVLIVEAMAQVGGLLVLETMENLENKIVYFMSVDKVKWRRPVTPGDQIRFEVEVMQIRGATCKMRGVGRVDGNVVAEAEMMARVVDR